MIRLDNALLGASDALVRWLWNEFGVGYHQVARAANVVWLFVLTLALSDMGQSYGLFFWAFMSIALVLSFFLELSRMLHSVEQIAAKNTAWRQVPLSRMARLLFVFFLVMETVEVFVLKSAWVDVFYQATWLGVMLINDAIPPTGPREPRRKEVERLALEGAS